MVLSFTVDMALVANKKEEMRALMERFRRCGKVEVGTTNKSKMIFWKGEIRKYLEMGT